MIERSLYSKLLGYIQIFYQNEVIDTQWKDQLVKIMMSNEQNSREEFVSQINMIRGFCHSQYLQAVCDDCVNMLFE